jgi:LysM repeat protein
MVDRKAPYSGIANLMALQGRMGDTELVHMSKPEIRGLQSLGEITINPDTGLPEAFNLKSIIPIVTTVAGGFFGGPAGAAAGSALGNFAVGERDVGNLAMNAALAYGIGTLAGAAASSNGLNAASAGFDSAGNVTQSSGIGFDYSLEGFVPPPNFTPSPLAAVPVASPPITAPTLPPVPVAEPSLVSKALGFAKEYPFITAGGLGLVGAGLMGEEEQQQLAYQEPVYERKPEDQVSLEGGEQVAALTPEKYEQLYTQGGGTQEQITSLQSPFRYVPKSTYASHGGLIGLAEGGAVQRFLDNSGDVEETPSNSPSTSTPQSAQSSISNFDKARLGLTALGFVTGNPALTAISTAANLVSPLSTAISNLTDPNVAVFSSAVPGQVQSSPLGMFSDSAPQIAGMRADIAMDVDGPSGEDGAGSSGEDSEMGNDDPSMGMSDMKTGGLIGLANGGMVTVQPGDTLTKIANETGMTVEGLQSLNNITNRNMIKVGQQLKISEGDSGLDIASIKEKVTDFLFTLPKEVRSGIMSLVPEGMLESFNKPEVEDTTDSKQVEQSEYPRPPEMPSTLSDMRVEQSDSNKRYFNDIVRPLEFGDEYYKKTTHFNPETNSYKAYKDSEGYLTFGPGVRVDKALKKLFKVQKFEEGKSELPRDEIDKIALKRWDKSIQEAKKLTNLPDDKVKPFAEMVYQMGETGVGKFTNMLKAVKEGDFEYAAIHALDSDWAKQMDKTTDEEYKGEAGSDRAAKVANRIQALGFPARAKGGNIGHYFQGQVDGGGDGQSDNVRFKVDARSKSDPSGALLSVDEYVLPADVVSMMGNGSSNAGASKLDNFVKSVRKESFGTTKQQKPYNTERGLSALV